MNVSETGDCRDMIIALRGGVPKVCDFCGRERPENELHPEEAGQWACIYCIDRWTEEDAEDERE